MVVGAVLCVCLGIFVCVNWWVLPFRSSVIHHGMASDQLEMARLNNLSFFIPNHTHTHSQRTPNLDDRQARVAIARAEARRENGFLLW